MAGAIAGGVLTSYLSWRSIFLINVPTGTVLTLVAILSLTRARGLGRDSLDLVGAGTATLGLAALIYGVMRSAEHSWISPTVAGPVAGGVSLLATFLVVEARLAKRPMVSPTPPEDPRGGARKRDASAVRRHRHRHVVLHLVVHAGGARLRRVGRWCRTDTRSGAVRAGCALGVLSAAARRARRLVLLGCGWLVLGFGWLAQSGADSSYVTSVLGPTLLVATGIGLTFPTLMGVATAAMPDDAAGAVGGLANTATQVGGSLGLALLATIAGSRSGSGVGGSALTTSPSGYSHVFYVAAAFALAIAAVSTLLPRQRARQLQASRNGG